MSNLGITRFHDGIPNGTAIPTAVLLGAKGKGAKGKRQSDGTVGKWAERFLISKFFPLEDGTGPDMPSLGIEIKTRTVGTNAMLTVGTMTVNDIDYLMWENTNLFAKLQKMYVIYYDRNAGVVTKNYIVDLRGSDLQEKFKRAYIKGSKIVTKQESRGIHESVKCSDYGFFEPRFVNYRFSGSFAFRIPTKGWRMVENEALGRRTFNRLFETT